MSFTATLYTIKDRKNVIGKTLGTGTEYKIVLKDRQTIDDINVDVFTNNSLITFNYCYIPIFNRYYFINDIEIFPNNIYRLHLHIDVLETYKEDILKITGNIFNATTSYSKIESSVSLPDTSNLILVTVGGVA